MLRPAAQLAETFKQDRQVLIVSRPAQPSDLHVVLSFDRVFQQLDRRIAVQTSVPFLAAQIGLAARAHELNRREDELAARERAIVQQEAELARRAGDADAQKRLREVEARLVQLQEAEKAFARSQAELAARSDDLARREAELLERRRAGARSAGHDLDRAALDELDERLRRLERETREAGESTFDGGLRNLAQRGVRSSPPTP